MEKAMDENQQQAEALDNEEAKSEHTAFQPQGGADRHGLDSLRDDESEQTRNHPHYAGRIQEGDDKTHSLESNECDQDPQLLQIRLANADRNRQAS